MDRDPQWQQRRFARPVDERIRTGVIRVAASAAVLVVGVVLLALDPRRADLDDRTIRPVQILGVIAIAVGVILLIGYSIALLVDIAHRKRERDERGHDSP